MASRDFSGKEIVNVLQKFGYRRDRTRGDHVILKYTHPETGEQRTVTVPLHDRVRIGTLQNIAEQCGADDFQRWCDWIDEHRWSGAPGSTPPFGAAHATFPTNGNSASPRE